jgi:hypothetical protein
LNDAIAAARQSTGVAASIVIDRIAVITGLGALHKAIAAGRVATKR